jgi:two-component system LytT family response regulator
MENAPLRAYLVDDEPLAIERLARLLGSFPAVKIAGTSTNPAEALQFLLHPGDAPIDVLFLDIQMPGMNGFELLAKLPAQPFVIFTTAFDEYALRAFQVNSIDYLLKPVDREQLSRALGKLGRLRPTPQALWQSDPQLPDLLRTMAASLRGERAEYPRRIASRVGERITFLDLSTITHFLAQDKLTYAVVNGRQHMVDAAMTELEERLDPAHFLRVHRSALVNLEWVQEVNAWFAGKMVLTLRDAQHTQLPVARDRVRSLKSRMGI